MKKKLLFIHNRLVCGGAENALFSLLNLLDKSKYDLTVFVLYHGGEWEQKFRDAGIRVLHSYSKVKEQSWLKRRSYKKNIDNARKDLGKNLVKLAIDEEFDLVISYHIPTKLRWAGMELSAGKIRYIHGDAQNNLWLKKSLEDSSDCLPYYDRYIGVSKQTQNAFMQETGITKHVLACFNPIESDEIYRKAEMPVEETLPRRYICAVGRLAPEKGFDRLIQIHKRILDDGVEHSLVMVGEGEERQRLENRIAQLGVADTVKLTGYRSNPYPYVANSAFTVCSSFAEGMPVASMESLCLGVPTVSAIEQVAELFGDQCCGIVTGNDDASLEAGIRKMLSDADFYRHACEGAQKRSAAFSSKMMIADVERIYDSVIAEKAHQAQS